VLPLRGSSISGGVPSPRDLLFYFVGTQRLRAGLSYAAAPRLCWALDLRRRYAAYCGFGSVSPLWGCVAGKDSMLAYAAISAYAPISPYAVVSAYPAISAYAVVPA
jgi:hypothetical protein